MSVLVFDLSRPHLEINQCVWDTSFEQQPRKTDLFHSDVLNNRREREDKVYLLLTPMTKSQHSTAN